MIIYPTSYAAQHPELEWLTGPDRILDPGRWFIVIPDMFGNGLSLSPSDTEDYPTLVTIYDNVQVQRRALAELFGIDRVACVYGWSMGTALRAIRARVLLMPGETDLYFRVADNEAELPFLTTASLRPIPGIWGHRAGNPVANPADRQFIRNKVQAWLAQ